MTKAVGRSAAGLTDALQQHISFACEKADRQSVTLYPRAMGEIIAEELLRYRGEIQATLAAKVGRIVRLRP